jgi:hypothetical protein
MASPQYKTAENILFLSVYKSILYNFYIISTVFSYHSHLFVHHDTAPKGRLACI